jgi:hypothetical protein
MALADLLAVCSPPDSPDDLPTVKQWSELETQLGTTFPLDYVALVERYGAGSFGSLEPGGAFFDLAYFLSPGASKDTNQGAIDNMRLLTEGMAKLKARWPNSVPAPVWPAPGGLLYVGATTTTHDIYWKTADDLAHWTCFVCDRGCDDWFHWDGDLTSLLAAIVTRKVPDWIVEGPTNFPLVFRSMTSLLGVPLA